jgi:hypothetical protein
VPVTGQTWPKQACRRLIQLGLSGPSPGAGPVASPA